ncbi:DNA-binding transcriptional MocR family regulator [Lederbergia galactosidilyticus]|nr:DNA-binding transcriptional MocR family regulator [Lederbergia galactosidilytica]
MKPGDAIAIEDPSYFYSLPLFQSAGLKIFYLRVDQDGINPDDVVKLYRKHRIRMIFLNPSFQNPTGVSLHPLRRKKIIEISSELGIPLVEDDPYSLISFKGENATTLKSMDENGNILYISSLSKIVASGLRIGWVIGPPKVIDRLADAKQQVDYGHSIFSQWAANEFLKDPYFDIHINRLKRELKKRRDEIVRRLNVYLHGEVEFITPEGGIHIWCRLNQPFNDKQLLEESMRKGVSFVPGSVYGSGKGYVRFTYGRGETEQIEEGISRFTDALNACKQK